MLLPVILSEKMTLGRAVQSWSQLPAKSSITSDMLTLQTGKRSWMTSPS
jgi:hypothetical protein